MKTLLRCRVSRRDPADTPPACDRKPTVTEKMTGKVNAAPDRRPGEKVRNATTETRDPIKYASKDVKDAVKETTK